MKRIIFTVFIGFIAFTLYADELSESIRQFIHNKPAGLSYEIDQENLSSGIVLQQLAKVGAKVAVTEILDKEGTSG